jgi:methylated-DNA-[protein]-cysteine S-methyltransferase
MMSELEELRTADLDGAADRAARAFAARAAEAGLADVAYTMVDSPFGPLMVATTKRGLVRLAYPHEDVDEALEELARAVSPRVLEAPGRMDEIRRELDQYFRGDRQSFEVPVDFRLTRGFTQKILRITARIPFGSLLTYGQVATKAGSPRAYRAAGNALGSNPIPIVVPCHRVVHADGGLGGYTGGIERKQFLLRLEGALR